MPPQGLVTDRVARNVEEARQALRLIFESTKTTEQVAGSAYGLMQAAGEILTTSALPGPARPGSTRTLIRPEPLKHRALSLTAKSSQRHDNQRGARGRQAEAPRSTNFKKGNTPWIHQHLLVLPALRAAFISTPPDTDCATSAKPRLELLAHLAPIANQPCPRCAAAGSAPTAARPWSP